MEKAATTTMFYPLLVLVPAVVLLFVKTSIELRKIRAIIADCPTLYTLILSSPLSAYLLPNSIPGVTAGCLVPYVWKHRYDALKHLLTGPDFVAIVSMLPNVFTTYVVADPVAIKDITFNRTRFHKQVAVYNILGAFGSNVVASEGELWKHYRKISASAFSERNARLVWEESVRVVDELINHKWEAKDTIQVDDALGLMLELALLVISGASFGQRISWDDEDVETNNHQLTFKHALEVASSDAVLRMVLPDWLLRLGPTRRIRQIKLAFDELEKYMLEMIEVRVHSDDKEDRHDLFSNLINANTDMQLSQEELLSHLLMFQIVGHDTSGSTLCFALALLALHQDIQEILFQETLTMMGGSRAPKNMNEFTYCKAVIYECLRMYPPVCYIPKTALEDTNIPFSKPDGGQMTIPILKGSTVGIDIIGLHHNPRYWEDPATFQPSRFLGDWNKDAFIPYFSGPRSCMGRSFFETEAVAVLTTLIHSFKIEVLEEPQFACETFAQRETRILDVVHDAIVLRPTRVPLVFKRRI